MADTTRDYQDILRDSLYVFSRYLVAEDFLDLLIKDDVLSLDDKELITNQFINQTRRQRATKLVEILITRGQHGYDRFMEYVEYLYPHVFTMVTGIKDPRPPPADLKRNRESDKLRLINELPDLAQHIKEQWHVNKELDTELTVLQHILEFAKEENAALEKENESLKDTQFENERLKLQIVTLEREKNEHQVHLNKEMLRTFDYIKERDESQQKLRDLQMEYDNLYKQHTELEHKTNTTDEAAAVNRDTTIKPPLPPRKHLEEKRNDHVLMEKKILMDELTQYKEQCEDISDKLHDSRLEVERLEIEVDKGPQKQVLFRKELMEKKFLPDELTQYKEKCEDISDKLHDSRLEVERLEIQVDKAEKELIKVQKENSYVQKQLKDATVKCDSYFEIIQKKDKELLENQSQKMKEEMRLRELLQSKNELFETNHRLEKQIQDIQGELDRIKARQSSSSVDIENSSSMNSASEEDSQEERRQRPIKKKVQRDEYEDDNLPDYYKASTMPAALNETPEQVFRRECAMFRYTMKKKKSKEAHDYVSSMTVNPSNSIRRNPSSVDDIIHPEALSIRREPMVHPADLEDNNNNDDSSSTSTVLVARAPISKPEQPVAPPKPAHLHKLVREKKLTKSPSQSEDEDVSGSVTDTSNRSSTTTNDSNDYSLSSDFPCWEISTQFLPKDCVRVNRPGLPDKNMCREVLLKYPVIDDKISIKGGNHTGIYIDRVLKPNNLSEGEEIKAIVYVPSLRNEETTTSLEGCTMEDVYRLLSEEYICRKKEREVKVKVKNCHQEYDSACKWMDKNSGTGDYIFVRCNMNVNGKSPNEVNLKQGDIYLITDTIKDQQKWCGKRIKESTGELEQEEVVLPNSQQANLRRFTPVPEGRRQVVKLKGQCYDRVLPLTASIKLPVYIVGPEKIKHAVIDLITQALPTVFVRMQKDQDKRSSEPPLQDVHFVTDGLLDTKSPSKSYGKIYVLINVTSILPEENYKKLLGSDFSTQNMDDPVERSTRIKEHLDNNCINYENIVLDSITSKDKLISTVHQSVSASQKRLVWLSADEIDESTAKKYVKYLGQDLSEVIFKVRKANSLDQTT